MIFPHNVLLSVILNYAIKYCNFFLGGTSPDTENDFLLAQMMQLEYDKEYDRTIDSMEKRYNGKSKGIKIRTGGKCKFMQCCNFLLKLFHIKQSSSLYDGDKPQRPFRLSGYSVLSIDRVDNVN